MVHSSFPRRWTPRPPLRGHIRRVHPALEGGQDRGNAELQTSPRPSDFPLWANGMTTPRIWAVALLPAPALGVSGSGSTPESRAVIALPGASGEGGDVRSTAFRRRVQSELYLLCCINMRNATRPFGGITNDPTGKAGRPALKIRSTKLEIRPRRSGNINESQARNQNDRNAVIRRRARFDHSGF